MSQFDISKSLTIMWFRQDLRLTDNPALVAAVEQGNVLPVYILDDDSAGEYAMGAASRWWLHHSLESLNASLQGKLNLYQGNAFDVIRELCERFTVQGIYWNRCYEPWRISRDKVIKNWLISTGVEVQSFNASLLNEPWTVTKNDGTPYKVFTPYHRQACQVDTDWMTLSSPDLMGCLHGDGESVSLASLTLLPKVNWDQRFYDCWTPGEQGASNTLKKFLQQGISDYTQGRDFPALKSVSNLSPHIHFGEISPRQIVSDLRCVKDDDNSEHFKREIGWREFSYYLLFHWPKLPFRNLKDNFDSFPWRADSDSLQRWQQGMTGYPIVDAGMRELWQTGYMHNRVRMITASFLVKNLLIDWRLGAAWFWDCLVDADLASNSASWQWVAGCGTDASPYFRIFNPITQGEKFDPQGDYIKKFIPELKDLPKKYLFKPWEAPEEVLNKANVSLGNNYPLPIVDIKQSRSRALNAYEATRQVDDY